MGWTLVTQARPLPVPTAEHATRRRKSPAVPIVAFPTAQTLCRRSPMGDAPAPVRQQEPRCRPSRLLWHEGMIPPPGMPKEGHQSCRCSGSHCRGEALSGIDPRPPDHRAGRPGHAASRTGGHPDLCRYPSGAADIHNSSRVAGRRESSSLPQLRGIEASWRLVTRLLTLVGLPLLRRLNARAASQVTPPEARVLRTRHRTRPRVSR